RRAVADLIRKEFGINLTERTVGQYVRRWGYTSKKPQRQARQQNPDEVEQWLEETYPAIEEQAAREDAEILWTDEVGVAADHHPATATLAKGNAPRWRCRGRTSGSIRFWPSARRGRSGS